MTHKEGVNQNDANLLMKNLKSSHIILGKDLKGFEFISSTNVGKFAQTAKAANSS